jgi:hypothetical protein
MSKCVPGCDCGKHNRPKRTPEESSRANRERGRKRSPEYNREINRRFREKHRERLNAQQRQNSTRNQLKYKHGISLEDRAAMWNAQQGNCYLCEEPLRDGTRQVHIDHDHTCCPQDYSCEACRRGLACHRCNLLLGFVKDDLALLRRIVGNAEGPHKAARERISGKPEQNKLPFPPA